MEQRDVRSQDQGDVGFRPGAMTCSLPDSEYAERLEAVIEDFSEGLEQIRELPDGYALRFPGSEMWIEKLVEFVAYERDCCPFFAFELDFEPMSGPVWLRLQGIGVKDFLDTISLPERGVSTHEGDE